MSLSGHPVPVKPIKPNPTGDTLFGFLASGGAFFLWGAVFPFYMKALKDIPAVEVIAHRAAWAVPVAIIVLLALGRTGDIIPTLKNKRAMATLFVTSAVITLNWGFYVWAISADRIVEAALGYYINPLISVAMGAFFLGERLNRLQAIAITLAGLAVIILTVMSGVVPWVSLILAFSFGIYGLLRKTVNVGPTQGFFIEVVILSFVAVPYIIWLQQSGLGHFTSSASNAWLLIGCGPITAIPLILFATGAKGLRLSTLGIMQYVVPSMIFLIGVFWYGEPFGLARLIAFSLIWAALAIFTWSIIRNTRKR